jgi:hypothetical protein
MVTLSCPSRDAARLAAGALLMFLLPPVLAASQDARPLIAAQITEGCGAAGAGQFAPDAIVERDLTGDDASDLLISHDGLACRSGGRSSFCGIRTCLVVFYVRQDGRLSLNTEVLSIGVTIGAGDPPVIELTSDDGRPNPLRWNGTTFGKR